MKIKLPNVDKVDLTRVEVGDIINTENAFYIYGGVMEVDHKYRHYATVLRTSPCLRQTPGTIVEIQDVEIWTVVDRLEVV